MPKDYKYGVYGEIGDTVTQSAATAGTTIVYTGTSPVNLVRGYADAGIINTPVKISNMAEAQRLIGYSAGWEAFTLSEAVYAHFANAVGAIGPIIVVNVLDPDVHRKASETDVTLAFLNGKAEIRSDMIIIDTLAVDSKAEGVDYSLSYSGGILTVKSIGAVIAGNVDASYYEVDTSLVTEMEIIGTDSGEGDYTGSKAVAAVYTELGLVPNLISAPGWSDRPSVYRALVQSSKSIGGHWEAFVLADLPVSADTIDAAKTAKDAGAYTSEFSKVFWPQAKDGSGNIVHLSTVAGVAMLQTDELNNGVPCETPANKPVDVSQLYFGPGTDKKGYDHPTANKLAAAGITTALKWGGRWVLWGDHTAAYAWSDDQQGADPRGVFDASIRMLEHVVNSFQKEWGLAIDKPLSKQMVANIVGREQEKLDMLVAQGALFGSPAVGFVPSDTADTMQGKFYFSISVTPSPPIKSLSVAVAYTDAGFAAFYNEGGDE